MFSVKWGLRSIQKEFLSLPSRVIFVLIGAGLAIFPLFIKDPYILRILTLACIFAIFAASWDFLAGYVGQISFGHALFFGIGAYSTAIISLRLGWPHWLTIILGALVAVLAGLLVGFPALRLKGPYLGLVTLAFPVMLTGVLFLFPNFTGGELGISGITRLASTRQQEYYIALVIMVVLCTILWKITDSKYGIIFHAIREDEIAVRASGINTVFYKLVAFSISGFYAGIAGGLYAHYLRIAGPGLLDILMSFQVIIWTILGGIATIYGPVVGVFVLYPLLEYLRIIPQYRMLFFTIVVILLVHFMPDGIANWIRDLLEKECPRCKERNALTRRECRYCFAQIRTEQK